jgi:2,3-dihydroxybenzoate-AMP ligase
MPTRAAPLVTTLVACSRPKSGHGPKRPGVAAMQGLVRYPSEFIERYRANGYWEDRSLWSVYAGCFERFADRTALIAGTDRLTYAELGDRAERLSSRLSELGLSPGDCLVVQLPNVTEFVDLFFACQRLGLVPLLTLPPHREHEIGHYVRFVGARAYAVPGSPTSSAGFDFVEFARSIRAASPSLEHLLVAGALVPPDLFSLTEAACSASPSERSVGPATVDPMDPCCLLLSGGTTGIPKVVARTHNDYLYNARISATVNGVDGDSTSAVCLPVGHNYPLNAGLLACWLHGAKVVMSSSTDAAAVLGLVERERATHLEAVPSLLHKWLADPATNEFDLSSVRVLNSAAQKLQPELFDRAGSVFGNAVVQEIFGMTEGLLMMNRLDEPVELRRGTVGRPISDSDEVRLVDDNGDDVVEGEIGELLCRGPYTFRGYLNAPEANARLFTSDGYYRSGDLLRRHPSGNYVIEGRKKDLVNRGGEKISVEEVEDMLLSHPGVRNVACVPMPDEVLGEKMCAFVVPSGTTGELSLDSVRKFLTIRGLARFKWPERLVLVEDLPLSNIGKVQKNVLAARAAELVAADG